MPRKKKYDVDFGSISIGDSKRLRSVEIEGETYLSSKDFLEYLLHLERSHHHLKNDVFVLNRLTRDFPLKSSSFWENEENAEFFEVIIEKINEHFGDWDRKDIVAAILESTVDDELKCKLIRTMKSIPHSLHDEQLLCKKTSTEVKLALFKFSTEINLLEEIALNDEDERVISKALSQIKIDQVTNPKVRELLLLEEGLRSDKRIELINESNNAKVLEHLVFSSNDFDIVKAARERLMAIPKSIKFVNKVA